MSDPTVVGSGSQHEFVDLHTHSTASDGSRAPADVVVAARAAGLIAFALTDHDTIAGLTDASAAGARLGVRVICGVELSAVEGDVETHILGLHLSELSELEHRLASLREMRLTRAARIVERLNALGIPVTLDAVLQQAAGGAVGRPHVARAMIAAEFTRTSSCPNVPTTRLMRSAGALSCIRSAANVSARPFSFAILSATSRAPLSLSL